MRIGISKHAALLLAKIAPLIGLGVVLSSIEATKGDTDAWTTLWRIGMSILLGAFVALVGAIYQNLNTRIKSLEESSRDDLVPRNEYDRRHDDLVDRLKRIEDVVTLRRR